MTGPDDADAALAEQLRAAHRRVAALDVDPAVKQRVVRRLLAVSDAAKHDTPRAARRLQTLLDDLDTGRVSASDEP